MNEEELILAFQRGKIVVKVDLIRNGKDIPWIPATHSTDYERLYETCMYHSLLGIGDFRIRLAYIIGILNTATKRFSCTRVVKYRKIHTPSSNDGWIEWFRIDPYVDSPY